MRYTIKGQLASAVADAGTFTVSYPNRISPEMGVTDEGDFQAGVRHKLEMGQQSLSNPNDFTLTFGTSNITVTNASGSTWAQGTNFILELEVAGKQAFYATGRHVARTTRGDTYLIQLGAPDVADADGVCASQSLNTGSNGNINGALASGGVATFDVPRNVVAAWTNTAVITITGVDEYGNTVVESSGSGTSLAGKKAFKKITRVQVSANVTGLTVGTGDVLGLPVFLPGTGFVLRELQDGAAPTAGTVVAGIRTEQSATTGDVRGTYDPNAACDGDKVFALIACLPDPDYLGPSQFAG